MILINSCKATSLEKCFFNGRDLLSIFTFKLNRRLDKGSFYAIQWVERLEEKKGYYRKYAFIQKDLDLFLQFLKDLK